MTVTTSVPQPFWQVGHGPSTVIVGTGVGQHSGAQGIVDVVKRMQSGTGPQRVRAGQPGGGVPVAVTIGHDAGQNSSLRIPRRELARVGLREVRLWIHGTSVGLDVLWGWPWSGDITSRLQEHG